MTQTTTCKLKKRIILAFIITAIVLIITNKYWLIFKPVPINLDILSSGTFNLKVVLNKNDDSTFEKIKDVEINTGGNNVSHVDLSVKGVKFPKRARFVISDLNDNDELVLSNIKVGKYNLTELEKFEVDGAKINIQNKKLVLSPNGDIITLTYPDTLHTKASAKFDIKIFIIILILTYLSAYKLTDYVADFKTVQGKSRADIIFLAIFFIFLFVPMSHIDNDETSKQENRTLAKWYPLINQENEINFNFGKNFESWFNDRFFMRDIFINSYDLRLSLVKNPITKDVIQGKENWLFLGWKESVASYSNSEKFTDEELHKIGDYLTQIDEYCTKNNKKFYFFIAPDKSKIYGEFYNDNIKIVSDKSKADQVIDYLNKNTNIKAIYPKNELIKSKKNHPLYWKMDTHWNELGAYFGYLELMNVVQKDFPSIKKYKAKNYKSEKYYGDLYNMLPKMLRKNDDTLYFVPDVNAENICKYPKEELYGTVSCNNPLGDKNLLMFRDSFSISLIPYIAQSFKNSKYVWQFNVVPDMMKNSDIIILEAVERDLPGLINSYME